MVRYILTILFVTLLAMPSYAAPKKKSKKKPASKQYTYSPARVHDIHNIAIWGGAGYSGLLNAYPATTGGINFQGDFSNQFVGGGGGLIGFGYEYKYKNLILSVGPEFRLFSSMDRLSLDGAYVQAMPEYSQTMNYSFTDFQENALVGQITLPIMLGATFNQVYFKAGAKIGYTLMGNYEQNALLTTTITDPNAYDPSWSDIPSHGANTSMPYTMSGSNPFGLDIALSAEVGVNIDKLLSKTWQKENEASKRPLRMRVALFADYGLNSLSVADPAKAFATTTDMGITTTSLHQSEWASSNLNSLLVGVKFTAMLQMNKEKTLKKPSPSLYVYTVDQATEKLLAGCVVESKDLETGKTRKKTSSSKGVAILRIPEGEYAIKASKTGYIPSDEIAVNHVEDKEKLTIALQPIPKYTVCVLDAKTMAYMNTSLSFVDVNTQAVVAQATTDSNTGSYTIALPLGSTYQLQVSATDYFAAQQLITDLAAVDTIYMQPIEKQKAIVLDNLYFASYQTTILPESEGALQQLYTMLAENPEVRIRIIGHTDDVGSDKDNQILSEGRAKSVRQAMIDRGIDATRIEFEGRGEKEPVASNKTEEGRAKNRRVEFVVL